MSLRRLIVVLATVSAAFLAIGSLSACQAGEKYPSRAITFSVVASPGAPADTRSRETAKWFEEILKVPVSVENRTAGGGMGAYVHIKSQPADGYNVVVGTGDSTFLFSQPDAAVGFEDLQTVIMQNAAPASLVVRAESEWKTTDELVKWMKANPGKLKIGGSWGDAGAHRAATDKFSEAVGGLKYTWVGFAGGNDNITALLGGHIDMSVMSPPVPMPHYKAGKLRFLGLLSEKRAPYLPEISTLKEQGINAVHTRLSVNFVKKGTPPEIVKTLHDTFKKTMEGPAWTEFLEKYYELEFYLNSADAHKYMLDDYDWVMKWKKSLGMPTR